MIELLKLSITLRLPTLVKPSLAGVISFVAITLVSDFPSAVVVV